MLERRLKLMCFGHFGLVDAVHGASPTASPTAAVSTPRRGCAAALRAEPFTFTLTASDEVLNVATPRSEMRILPDGERCEGREGERGVGEGGWVKVSARIRLGWG